MRDLEALKLRVCQVDGCDSVATGGVCSFAICFRRGCERDYCLNHAGEGIVNNDEEMQTEAMAHSDTVCLECQSKLKSTYKIAMLLLLLVPILFMMPAIFMYSNE